MEPTIGLRQLRRTWLALALPVALAACAASVPPPASSPPAAPPTPAPASAPAPAAARPVRVTILHTNDHHGHAWRWQRRGGEVGSLAARAALIARVRAEVAREGGHVLLLDAGDFNTGSYCSDELHAAPDLAAYRAMRYDAAALGNHEFDQPLDVLKGEAAAAGFPLLGANVLDAAKGTPELGATASWSPGGVRVVALGLTPGDTPGISTNGKDPRLRFLDPIGVASVRVPELRRDARLVVGLFHLPLDEIERLVARVPGIDLVVSGHDHRPLDPPVRVGATTIVQAGSDGRFLGRVDLEVPPHGPPVVTRTRLYPITGDLPEDPGIAELLAQYRGRCSGAVPVGRLAAAAPRDDLLAGAGSPSPLANLVADALRAAGHADVAFVNRGGLRTDLPGGVVTREQVHDVLPFADTITVLEVTGADLLALVGELSRRDPGGHGLLYPAGLTIRVRGPGNVEVRRHGRPLRPRDRLKLAVSSFLAGGGDGFATLAALPHRTRLAVSPAAALEAWLKAHDPATPPREARIVWDRAPSPRPQRRAHSRAPAPPP